MSYTASTVLLFVCLSILFSSVPSQINAQSHVGNAIWSIIRVDEVIPPQSLIPRSRVKRVKRDAFDHVSDHGREFLNASERVKQHLPVWNDVQGEPLLN